MQVLNLSNFSAANILQTAKLDADAAVGATTLRLAYTDDLANGDLIYIGMYGAESGELVTVDSVNSSSEITIATATVKPHTRFETVSQLFGDQLQVYRADNVNGLAPDPDQFSKLGAPIDIKMDSVQTRFEDPIGGAGYWYRFVYVNGASETELKMSVPVRGDVVDYASIESIRKKAGLSNNRHITDADVDEKRQSAQSLINATLVGIYELPFKQPVPQLIAECTRLLAAGYLLTDDYGPLNTLNTNEGQQMIDRVTNAEGTGYLDRLDKRDLLLPDGEGAVIIIPDSSSVSGWPNSTTKNAPPERSGGDFKFRVSDIY